MFIIYVKLLEMLNRAYKVPGTAGPDRGRLQTQKGKEKGRYKDRLKSRPQGSNPRDTCNYYKEEGHKKFNCPMIKEKGQVTVVAKDNSVSKRDLVLSVVDYKGTPLVWIMDLASSYHISRNQDWFVAYKEFDGGHVFTDLKKLISLGVLYSKGFKYMSENGVLHVLKGALVAMKATKEKSNSDLTMLWHMRLGHMSEKCMVATTPRTTTSPPSEATSSSFHNTTTATPRPSPTARGAFVLVRSTYGCVWVSGQHHYGGGFIPAADL
nr:retrovirus-related Pol polyprotein from transposon TNT 1-94 [Tanacetum cinerariifolium]